MATMTVQTIALAGIVPSYAAVAASDVFANTGDQYIHVKNGGGAPSTVTLTTPATIDGVAIADPTVTVAAGAEKIIGPFPPAIFNDANGQVTVVCSPTTSVTMGVFKL